MIVMLPSTVETGNPIPAASDKIALANVKGYTPASLPNIKLNVQILPSLPVNAVLGIE